MTLTFEWFLSSTDRLVAMKLLELQALPRVSVASSKSGLCQQLANWV